MAFESFRIFKIINVMRMEVFMDMNSKNQQAPVPLHENQHIERKS